MRIREITDDTFIELSKLTTPLSGETLDTVIMRLIKAYRKNGHAPIASGFAKGTHTKFTARKTHPDKLIKFIRPKYQGIPYWQAADKIIKG